MFLSKDLTQHSSSGDFGILYPRHDIRSSKQLCHLKTIYVLGTSLVVQWLRFHAPNAGGLGSIPGQGTRSHTLQLKTSWMSKYNEQ